MPARGVIARFTAFFNANTDGLNQGIGKSTDAQRRHEAQVRRLQRAYRNLSRRITRFIRSVFNLRNIIATLAGGAGFGLLVRNTAEWARQIVDAANKTGLAVQQVQGFQKVFQETGRDLDVFVDLLNTLGERVVETDLGESIGESFEALGINVRDATGALLSQADALRELERGYNRLNQVSPTAALRAISDILGGEGANVLIPLFLRYQNQGGIFGAAAQREQGLPSLNREQLERLDRVNDSIRDLRNLVSTTVRSFVADNVDAIHTLIDTVDELLRGVIAGLGNVFDAIVSGFATLTRNIESIVEIGFSLLVVQAGRAIGSALAGLSQSDFTVSMIGDIINRRLDPASLRVAIRGALVSTGFGVGVIVALLEFIPRIWGGNGYITRAILHLLDLFGEQGNNADLTEAIDESVSETKRLQRELDRINRPITLNTEAILASIESFDDAAKQIGEAGRRIAESSQRSLISDPLSQRASDLFDIQGQFTVPLNTALEDTGETVAVLDRRLADLRSRLDTVSDAPFESLVNQFDNTVDLIAQDIASGLSEPIANEIRMLQAEIENAFAVSGVVPESLQRRLEELVAQIDLSLDGAIRQAAVLRAAERGIVRPDESQRPSRRLQQDIETVQNAIDAMNDQVNAIRRLQGIINEVDVSSLSYVDALRQALSIWESIVATTDAERDLLEDLSISTLNLIIRYERLDLAFERSLRRQAIQQQLEFQRGIGDAIDEQTRSLALQAGQYQRIADLRGIQLDVSPLASPTILQRQIDDLFDSITNRRAPFGLLDLFVNNPEREAEVLRRTESQILQIRTQFAGRDVELQRQVEAATLAVTHAEQDYADSIAGSGQALVEAESARTAAIDALARHRQGVEEYVQGVRGQVEANERLGVSLEELTELQTDFDNLTASFQASFESAFEAILFEGRSFKETFSNLILEVLKEIARVQVIRPLAQAAGSFLGSLAGGLPGFQSGGIASGFAVVGEGGPEIIDFRTPTRVYSNDFFRSALNNGGGGVAVQNNVNVNTTDARAGFAEAKDAIVQASVRQVQSEMGNASSPLAKTTQSLVRRTS